MVQAELPPPAPQPCNAVPLPPAPPDPPAPQPTLINYALIQQIVREEVQRVYDQSERTHGDVAGHGTVTQQIQSVAADLKAHDERQNRILAFLTDAKTLIGEGGVIAGWLINKYVIK
jgi:hypothetical protein